MCYLLQVKLLNYSELRAPPLLTIGWLVTHICLLLIRQLRWAFLPLLGFAPVLEHGPITCVLSLLAFWVLLFSFSLSTVRDE